MPKAPAKIAPAPRAGRATARGRKRPALPRHIEIRQRGLAATIGAAAKQARTRAGLTQADVAAAVGTHPEVYGLFIPATRSKDLSDSPPSERAVLTLEDMVILGKIGGDVVRQLRALEKILLGWAGTDDL